MRSVARSFSLGLTIVAAACGGGATTPSAAPPPAPMPLGSLAATGAIVTPAFAVDIPTQLDWSARADGRMLLRGLDSAIATSIATRGLRRGWILAVDLAASYRRNPTYAADPYTLAEEPLRGAAFGAGSRLPEPLASQLRTMIALHDGARFVLLPVQLSFEPAAPNAARASLKVALVDPRFSEARWVGEVRSDTVSSDPRVLTDAVARRLVDLIVSR